MIGIFVRRDIVATYKQTVLGPLWLFLGPLFTVAVYTFVFDGIAQIGTDDIPAPLFYLAGTTLWSYFQTCLTATSTTFVTNAGIFGKVYFPRLVSPISVVIANLLKLGIQFCLFACFMAYYMINDHPHVNPNVHLLGMPFLIILMGGISLGLGVIVSAMTTKYRDLSYFITFGVTLIMYATPVIYPVSEIPDMYLPILKYNPIAPIIETFRFSVTGEGNPDYNGLLYSGAFMLVVLFVGVVMFTRTEKSFMDTV